MFLPEVLIGPLPYLFVVIGQRDCFGSQLENTFTTMNVLSDSLVNLLNEAVSS